MFSKVLSWNFTICMITVYSQSLLIKKTETESLKLRDLRILPPHPQAFSPLSRFR